MKAIAVTAFKATPELVDVPNPEVRPGTVLIRVSAAGMNPFDWKMIDGILDGQMPHQFPMIVGVDGAGTVTAIGEGVTRFKIGDKIYGQFIHAPIGEGSYAEYAVVPESASITTIPDGISFAEAAAIPTSGMTAQQMLEQLDLQPGQTVLINGATGGVGSFTTQLAALHGLHVIATAHGDDISRMKKLGAKEVIDYKAAPLADQVKQAHPDGIDGLIDVVSNADTLKALSALVKKGGPVLTTVFVADEAALKANGLRGGNFETKGSANSLDKLKDALGKIEIPIARRIKLTQVASAIEDSRNAISSGKTIIEIDA
ncbi:NADP-dependent oxidoreductase [Chitinophaga pendula]|uniref:NADP-dependent oxidoreductase n=1 Tax=Chitinophaga TaxID=79328 RepID=UPI000BAF52BD|nr:MULTISPECIES: NADP-dependent oxidoreductase [Chitinophaga]ASZ12865.1 alcohol dehydrogenase [Chitinophaga sp. MD30]UCJ09504.1 NADP-dependent oxidoreductase [Chitinophaga pendula]